MTGLEESSVEAAQQKALLEQHQPAVKVKLQFCRLCLKEEKDEKLIANIFEITEDSDQTTVAQKVFDLFHIQYEQSPDLPDGICQSCFDNLEDFNTFRESVKNVEDELQKFRAKQNQPAEREMQEIFNFEQRPGLNEFPGVFTPEENAVIIEMNPNDDYESTEDEFSMESDTEVEEPALANAVPTTTGSFNDFNTKRTPQSAVHSTAPTASSLPSTPSTHDISISKSVHLCQYCDMAFCTNEECLQHEAMHGSDRPFVCNHCNQRTDSRQSLIAHVREFHDNDRPFVCPSCQKGFCRRSDLKKHSIVHLGLKPYTCNICAKSFSRNANLSKHMRTHSGVKHPCAHCPRSFNTSIELLRHQRSHVEASKQFKCSHCAASFTRKDKLQLHEQTHLSGVQQSMPMETAPTMQSQMANDSMYYNQGMENLMTPQIPFQGNEALQNQQFQQIQQTLPIPQTYNMATLAGGGAPADDLYRQSLLAAHLQQQPQQMQQHVNINPTMNNMQQQMLAPQMYSQSLIQPIAGTQQPLQPQASTSKSRHFSCEICSQTFTREREFQRHQALHLDTLFQCKQCGIGFSRREKLARHELEQHSPQYTCNICRATFNRSNDFEAHMRLHEMQQNMAFASGNPGLLNVQQQQQQMQQMTMQPQVHPSNFQQQQQQQQRPPPSTSLSYYNQVVPTMNLGFYSETHPDDQNN